MKPVKSILALSFVVAATTSVAVQQKGGGDETGPYDVVENWLKPLPNHEGWTFGQMAGVFAETADRIYLVVRGEVPFANPAAAGQTVATGQPGAKPKTRNEHLVFIVNRNGELAEAWTQWDNVLVSPHKISISPYDPDKHVWVTDTAAHQVFKFTHDGKRLVMTVGEKQVPGDDGQHFNQPADIAFLPDGSFLVADGYVNARIAKFDKNGKFLTAWGSKGTGPGQFNLVHCVAIDAKRRVYAIDRVNHRIQIFDENGKFLDQWPNIEQATHLIITQDQFVWLSDGVTNRMMKYDLNGKLLTYWGVSDRPSFRQGAPLPGALNDPHQFSVDPDGNLYIANYYSRVKKFIPKPNADRSRLVGQPFVARGTN